MEIRLPGATVRSWRRGDEESLARRANNRKVWINLRDAFPSPYTLGAARQWIEWVSGTLPETHFAIEVEGGACGGIGYVIQPDVHRISAEIGFWLGEPFWGRGIMTEAVRAVTAHALDTHNLHRVYASVFDWNPASMRVLEKAGYRREGIMRSSALKDGKVTDQVLYALTR
ncbi:MAG TPA: GNAT family protein [Gemmatimonadales bacterium]